MNASEIPDSDWAAMEAIILGRPVPMAQATPVPTPSMAPIPVVQATVSTEEDEPVPIVLRTADEIMAERALMPQDTPVDDARQMQDFLSAPDPTPTPRRVKIAPKGASRNPTRDAIERLADEVYELRLLMAEVHKLVLGARSR